LREDLHYHKGEFLAKVSINPIIPEDVLIACQWPLIPGTISYLFSQTTVPNLSQAMKQQAQSLPSAQMSRMYLLATA
jgi:hypothetical protein